MVWNLFGCEGDGPSVVSTFSRGPMVWSSYVYATQDGGLLMQIHNPPFGDPDGVGRVALRQFETAFPERLGRFTLNLAEAREPTMRIVLVFDPPAKWDARNTCRGERPATLRSEPGRLRVQASFCARDDLLAAAEGWVKNAKGAADPRLGKLLTQIALNLITRGRDD